MDLLRIALVFAAVIAASARERDLSFICPAQGIFPDPGDCHNFYSCDSDLQATPGTCMSRVGSFDVANNVCTILPCSPTDPPVETPALGTFTCVDVGVFADPSDCRSYYICYTLQLARHYTCESGRFDPLSLGCLEAPC